MSGRRRSPRVATMGIGDDGSPVVPDLTSAVKEALTSTGVVKPRKPNKQVIEEKGRMSPRAAVASLDHERGSFTMNDDPRLSSTGKVNIDDATATTTTTTTPDMKSTSRSREHTSRDIITRERLTNVGSTRSKSASRKSIQEVTNRPSEPKEPTKEEKAAPSRTTRSSPSETRGEATLYKTKPTTRQTRSSRTYNTATIRSSDSLSEVKVGNASISNARVPEERDGSVIPTTDNLLKSFIQDMGDSNITGDSEGAETKIQKSVAKLTEEEVDSTLEAIISHKIPKGKKLVSTDSGNFVIPDYDKMSPEQLRRERVFLEMNFMKLNQNWKKHGFKFRRFKPTETLEEGEIRYQLSCQLIAARTGNDIYKIMLFGLWVATEVALCHMGIPASGYFESQLMVFNIYERSLIEMGQSSGFGKDFSPMTKIIMFSAINAAILIFLNKMSPDGGKSVISSKVMRRVASNINGTNYDAVTDLTGAPVPVDSDPAGEVLENMGMGDIMSLVGAFTGDGEGGISSMLGNIVASYTKSKCDTNASKSKSKSKSGTRKVERVRQRKRPTYDG